VIVTAERWAKLCDEAHLVTDAMPWCRRLLQGWTEPQRHYHTLQHLEDCLATFDEVSTEAADPVSLELALWFHDAIYTPQSLSNEEDSAQLAHDFLQSAGAHAATISRVFRLILATKTHDCTVDLDAPLLMDIDLSILGSDPGRFKTYENQIRQEYDWVPWRVYCEKRSAILQSFLDRPQIFNTASFRERCEAQARLNLARSIELLKSGLVH